VVREGLPLPILSKRIASCWKGLCFALFLKISVGRKLE
jgi:hypothetical protein